MENGKWKMENGKWKGKSKIQDIKKLCENQKREEVKVAKMRTE